MESVVLAAEHAAPGSTSAAPEISILLVNWNTKRLILECLDSLPGSIPAGVPYETIVVDNASCDGSAAALAERGGIVFLPNNLNVGYAAAVNLAYRRSTGRLVLLLNSDVVFRPGALEVLRRFLIEHPDVAGVGPLYLNPDGTLQHFHYRLPTLPAVLINSSSVLRKVPWLAGRVRDYKMQDDDFSREQPVEQPATSCLLLRRSALADDKIFDERFPIYYNDVYFAHELASRGLRLWMTPRAVVVHEEGASVSQLGRGARRQHLASLVTYLGETQPAAGVLLFQTMALLQGAARRAIDRSGLPLRELWRAVRGDPGPLPQAPAGWRER